MSTFRRNKDRRMRTKQYDWETKFSTNLRHTNLVWYGVYYILYHKGKGTWKKEKTAEIAPKVEPFIRWVAVWLAIKYDAILHRLYLYNMLGNGRNEFVQAVLQPALCNWPRYSIPGGRARGRPTSIPLSNPFSHDWWSHKNRIISNLMINVSVCGKIKM